jgi:hypothetical protein
MRHWRIQVTWTGRRSRLSPVYHELRSLVGVSSGPCAAPPWMKHNPRYFVWGCFKKFLFDADLPLGVAPDYHVEVDDHYYSVPFALLRENSPEGPRCRGARLQPRSV